MKRTNQRWKENGALGWVAGRTPRMRAAAVSTAAHIWPLLLFALPGGRARTLLMMGVAICCLMLVFIAVAVHRRRSTSITVIKRSVAPPAFQPAFVNRPASPDAQVTQDVFDTDWAESQPVPPPEAPAPRPRAETTDDPTVLLLSALLGRAAVRPAVVATAGGGGANVAAPSVVSPARAMTDEPQVSPAPTPVVTHVSPMLRLTRRLSDTLGRFRSKPQLDPWFAEIQRALPQYQIIEHLNRGGLADIIKVKELSRGNGAASQRGWRGRTSRRVLALKFPREDKLRESFENTVNSLRAEAKTRESLFGDFIVTIVQTSVCNIHVAGGRAPQCTVPYYAMEYIAGGTLREYMRRDSWSNVAFPERIELIQGVLQGLREAHHSLKPVYHLDLKPENIMIVGDGGRRGRLRPKLIDFGSTALGESTTGGRHATPAYSAPEHLRPSAMLDGRTDLFSLGLILFEVLTDRRFFADPKNPGRFLPGPVIHKHLQASQELQIVAPELDHRLLQVLQRLLRKDPEERFQSVQEVQFALKEFQDGDMGA
jgi:serine/threonine protein kinase